MSHIYSTVDCSDVFVLGHQQVAMAMAAKAKMLLRELKTVRGDLTFLRDRCSQLEEENRRLRESVVKGTRPDEDDLVIFTISLTFLCCSTYFGTIRPWHCLRKATSLKPCVTLLASL